MTIQPNVDIMTITTTQTSIPPNYSGTVYGSGACLPTSDMMANYQRMMAIQNLQSTGGNI